MTLAYGTDRLESARLVLRRAKTPAWRSWPASTHAIEGNRCHETDGCSAPGVIQVCADDPMSCPYFPRPAAGSGPCS